MDNIDRLCELITRIGIYGWEVVFDLEDGISCLNEAVGFGLVWLTTQELIDLSCHIPITAEYRPSIWRRDGSCWHRLASALDDQILHESYGGVEVASAPSLLHAFPDDGQPVWKVIAAPNPPQVMVAAPNWPTAPQSPATRLANPLISVIA
ncbi:MAG: hypothetical protein HC853_00145 [Anaerolineae bacterium]|nr:hypothetical protein [Anaerolineae bacterium]